MRAARWFVVFGVMAFTALAAPPVEPPPGVRDGRVVGKVKERLEAGGYAYLLLVTDSGEHWAAVPQSTAKAGDTVTVAVQAQMAGFESKTLKRRFEKIFFGTLEGAAAEGPVAPTCPSPGVAQPIAAAPGDLVGAVREVIQVPNYTYLRLITATGERWAAVPTAPLTVGAQVRISKPAPMDGFFSKSLNRTFERIDFGSLAAVSEAKATAARGD